MMRVSKLLQHWRRLLAYTAICIFLLALPFPGTTLLSEASQREQSRIPLSQTSATSATHPVPQHVRGAFIRTPSLVLHARAAYNGIYCVGSWVPVHVTLQNVGTNTTTSVQVHGPGGTVFATTLELPRGAHKSITIYAFVHRFVHTLHVRVVQSGTTVQDGDTLLAQQQVVLDPQTGNKQIIATIAGDGANTLNLPPELTNGTRLTEVPLTLRDLPTLAVGLSTFDTVILNNVPTLELSAAQRTALHAWVLQGGRLIVGGGTGAQRTLEGLPEALHPVSIAGTQEVNAAMVLGAQTTTSRSIVLSQAELIQGTPPTSILSNMAIARDRGSIDSEATPLPMPLLAVRPVGNGIVSFAAMSLNDPALMNWSDQQLFWSDLVQPQNIVSPFSGSPDLRPQTMTEGNLATTLTRLPALQAPSLVTLGLLLLVYILLVGPVTYLLLRRFDRQALGWVVVPLITIVFAVVAYGLSYAQRGGDILINQVALIELLDHDVARARSFAGIFSPEQRSYTLDTAYAPQTVPAPTMAHPLMLRPISIQGPWSMNEVELSGTFFQEAQEERAGGVPQETTAHATNLNIAQWSMRGVMSDDLIAAPDITVNLVLQSDAMTGEVINNSPYTLEDVVLVQSNHVVRLGDMQPGTRQTTSDLALDERVWDDMANQSQNAPLSYLIYQEQIDVPAPHFHQPLSPDIQQRMALLDAVYPYERPRSMQPLLIAWLKQTPVTVTLPDQRVLHQQLALLTTVPRIQVESDQINLSTGWFQREFDGLQVDNPLLCLGSRGIGISLFENPAGFEPVYETLRLPPELTGLHPHDLKLVITPDGDEPDELVVDVFDWTNGEWVTHTFNDTSLALEQPERFLSSGGELRLNFDPAQQTTTQTSGCFFIDATVRGTLDK